MTAETPLGTAMRAVLAERMGMAARYLKRLGRKKGRNARNIHQLRVATRRLGAALSIFKDSLGRRAWRRLDKTARRLRRAAGAARDLDVQRDLLEQYLNRGFHLTETPSSATTPRWPEILDRKNRQARKRLKNAVKAEKKRFRRAAAQLPRAISRKDAAGRFTGLTLTDASRSVLRDRLEQFSAAGETDLSDFDSLHALRITAKRLRYTMEIFAACYPPAFGTDLYERVREAQNTLGEINDLRNLWQTLAEWCAAKRSRRCAARATRNALHELLHEINGELAERRRRFLDWWSDWRDSLQSRFQELLAD